MIDMSAVMAEFSLLVVAHNDPGARDHFRGQVFQACTEPMHYAAAEVVFKKLADDCHHLGLGEIAELWEDCACEARACMGLVH